MIKKQRMDQKTRAALTTIAFSIVWLIFGSSVSILSPTDGGLGVLFGLLFSISVILLPIYYVKFMKIRIKNPRPLFVEPSAWLVVPLSFIVSAAFFVNYILVLSLTPLNFLSQEFEKESFVGNSIMMIILFTSLFGPVTVYYVYIRTHYKKIVEFNSAEWKKIKKTR